MKTALQVKYLGGPDGSGKPKPAALYLDDVGVKLKVSFKTVLEAPWSDISALEVEGPDQVEKRITMTRLVGLGIFALAAKKKSKTAYLTVTTSAGDFIFESEKLTPQELRGKLSWAAAKVAQ